MRTKNKLRYLMGYVLMFFLLASCQSDQWRAPDYVKKPYEFWRGDGVYPGMFRVDVISTHYSTQNGFASGTPISVGRLLDSADGWDIGGVTPYGLRDDSDLPTEVYICWASLFDQAIYVTYIEFTEETRKKMVEPHPYVYQGIPGIGYYNHILFGFAPRGHVTAWLVNPTQRNSAIEVATGLTKRYNLFTPWDEATHDTPYSSTYCENPYNNLILPQLTEDEKEWIKQHGVPEQWQEEVVTSEQTPDEKSYYRWIEYYDKKRAEQQKQQKEKIDAGSN